MDHWLAISPGRLEGTYIFPSTLAITNYKDDIFIQSFLGHIAVFIFCNLTKILMYDYHARS